MATIPAIGISRWAINSKGNIYRLDGYVGIGTTNPGGLLGLGGNTVYIDVDGGNLRFTDITGSRTVNDIVQDITLLTDTLDSYASDQTVSEHNSQISQAIQTITKDIDGYSLDYTQVTSEPTGFPNRTDSAISFNDGLRRFTIAPTGVSFDYYIKGTRFTETATRTVDISDTEGLHFIYFDGTSLLSTTTFSESLLKDFAYVSVIYWDATNNTHVYFADERHGLTMDWSTHIHMHTSFGAQYTGGLALGSITADGDGSLDAHGQLSVSDGSIRDEDLKHTITDGSPQTLSFPAEIPVLYRSGANGDWRIKSADTFPIIYSGTAGYVGVNGRLPFNEFTGSTWQLTEIGNGSFVLVHILATNDTENPIVAIQGQDEFGNAGEAQENATSFVVEGLPFAEFVPIGTVIFESRTNDTNTIKGKIVSTGTGDDYVDLRGFSYTATGNTGSHSNLSNLGFDESNHSGFQRKTFEASVDPNANHDGYDSAGVGINFSKGDFWTNILTQSTYTCKDNSLGAAVWDILSSSPLTATEGADGYIAFFTGSQSIAGDNDLFFNRANHNLSLTGGGKVGVGTTVPGAFIHVVGEETVSGVSRASLRLEDSTTSTSWTVNTFGSGSSEGGGNFGVNLVGSGNKLILTPEGRLGLGASTPDARLHVAGDGYFDGYLMPRTDNVHGLGTPDLRWRDLYLGPESLHIISKDTDSGRPNRTFSWHVTESGSLELTDDGVSVAVFDSANGASFPAGGGGEGGLSATQGSDGYIAFFTGSDSIAGDNDLFFDRVNNNLVLGKQLILPSANTPSAPAVAFGDGDTGFYENVGNTLNVSVGGNARYQWNGDTFQGIASGAPKFRDIDSTATQPNIFPDRSDSDTGIGSAGADQLSLITNGAEQVNIASDGYVTFASGISVGGNSGVDGNLDVGNELTAGSVFLPPRLTTTERDALTPVAGMVIFNTSTQKHQGYDGTAWNDFYA